MTFDHFRQRLQQRRQADRLRRLTPRRGEGITIRDAAGRTLINFGGNDYLGLAIGRRAAAVATGSGASALVCGWTDQHQRLVERIAELESTDSACLFPTGFAACSGVVATLPDPEDLILSDQLNHASLIDGCRLSRARRVIYPHRDVASLRPRLDRDRGKYRRVWIVTDGVFSMDGHVAPLGELCDLAERFDATLIVDEAHGTGVLGQSGSGVCEAMGVKQRVPIRIGTLSKALGSQGGFLAGPEVVVDYVINHCRSLIYSTALAPAAVAAAIDAIDSVCRDRRPRRRVQQWARLFRRRLSIEASSETERSVPIVPVVIGGDQAALAASETLADRGFFVPAIRPPTVPEGTARLRVSLSAAHDEAMVQALASAIADLVPAVHPAGGPGCDQKSFPNRS
jgi:8-amino-7-oxononanoate synthase